MLGIQQSASHPAPIVIATLIGLPPVAKPILSPTPVAPKPAPVKPKAQKKTISRPQKISAEPEVPDTPIRETRTPILPTDAVSNIALGNAAEPVPITDNAANAATPTAPVPAAPPTASPTAAPSPTANALHFQTKPPPSAELKYDVEALSKGQTYHGGGKITWQTDGSHYTINGEAGVLFISALDFKSTGEINGFGVAPTLYTEKKFRKPPTSTTFQRDQNTITFSASANNYPRTGGEQDRASIVWQLASIGRGDASQIIPGSVIDLFVAGDKDAETWRFQVLGQEDIKVSTGTVKTWHLARKPQLGSTEKTLDIWLAPEQQWYPVRLRFTEKDGDYLDMSLSNLKQLVASAAPG